MYNKILNCISYSQLYSYFRYYNVKQFSLFLRYNKIKKTSTLPLLSISDNYTNYRFASFDNNKSEQQENIEKLLDDATITEEQHVEHESGNWATSPYPKGSYIPHKNQSQAQHALRPKVDPKETSILLFPGQGTQFVEGPKSKLDQTMYSQPAILVCSLGAVEKLKEEQPSAIENCMAAAGYSVGELAALTFAGVFTFEQAIQLVKVRAEAMHYASEIEPGGMATIFLSPESKLNYALKKAREWCQDRGIEKPVCRISNYLNPYSKVIAGHLEALKYLEFNLKEFNLRKMQRLNVSGAFHTELMKPAVEPFLMAIRKMNINEPMIAVHSNIDGKHYKNSNHIVRNLPKQICLPVKWEQTLHILYERPQGSNFPDTFECGPGSTLRSLLKTVNSKAHSFCTSVNI
ncbi:probable malonyl-CoA-acyl carrier protein transacylase, mitochondrial isoform X2 [Daktulosphaira vitifoliae]|uniref:probable malonyl-CoA-acyl carrier protein transacylase, mitochondrial isoform X2 n=1 Tax=Daktulosphaira vitifoliae TaxID=58002 RepID=UPI0021AA513B|nr:probable malonyl-CoA-acyl carrier protein transacylase, mitochondrial isoform X2 [Daktulosphaira vitifoliae]